MFDDEERGEKPTNEETCRLGDTEESEEDKDPQPTLQDWLDKKHKEEEVEVEPSPSLEAWVRIQK